MKKISDNMLIKNKKGNFQTEIINIEEIVPQDHILRIIEKELDKEIEVTRKSLKEEDTDYEEIVVNDEQTNHEKKIEETVETKEILKSTIDPDAGVLYKDEKEKMIAYNTSIISDKRNYILSYDTNPSNMHDSKAFYPTYKKFKDEFGTDKTKYFAGDAAYITTHICKTVTEDGN